MREDGISATVRSVTSQIMKVDSPGFLNRLDTGGESKKNESFGMRDCKCSVAMHSVKTGNQQCHNLMSFQKYKINKNEISPSVAPA